MRTLTLILLSLPVFSACSSTNLSNGVTCIQSAGATGTASSQAVSFSATPTVGNHVILGIYFRGSNPTATQTLTDNQGNTYAFDKTTVTTGSYTLISASTKIATASGTFTVTYTPGSFTQNIQVIVTEMSGLATASWADVGAVAGGSSSGSHSSGTTATTAQATELLAGLGFMACAACAITAGSGYTKLEQVAASGFTTFFQAKTVASTGTYAAAFTDSQGFGDWASGIFTYKIATGGGGSAVRRLWVLK